MPAPTNFLSETIDLQPQQYGYNQSGGLLQTDITSEKREDNSTYFKSLELLSPARFICTHWHDREALDTKWHELEERRIDEKLTTEESRALQILEKRILDFPNPYAPADHKRAQELIKTILG